jgi:outer membrane protein OmpA-like peptidoglycan-associated protein
VDLRFLRLTGNLAYHLRPRVRVQDLLLDDTLDYGAGLKFSVLDFLDLTTEVNGSVVAKDFDSSDFNPDQLSRDGTSPMELLMGAHFVADFGLQAYAGYGAGLNSGVGAPDWRVFAGLGYRSPLNLDEDGDGIPDRKDRCLKDPENFNGVIDEDGCPEPDTDGDTIVDPVDACPTAAEDMDGFQDEDGCPDLDNDGDGIPDNKDQCPNESEDKDGFEDSDGCPDVDNDRDGINDTKDRCSNQAEDFDGFEDEDGCPELDNDQDGVPDTTDRCPNDLEDRDSWEDDDGCPDRDNDSDGFADDKDRCPNEPEVINSVDDEDGCPDQGNQLVLVKDDRLVILFPVHFETNRATIRADSEQLLNQVAGTIKGSPYIKKLRIEGHTDSDGDDKANLALSQGRAESVRDYLVKAGVDPNRLEAVGYGETRPIASNRTAAGKEKNRRVDFIIVDREKPVQLQKKKPATTTTPAPAPAVPAK